MRFRRRKYKHNFIAYFWIVALIMLPALSSEIIEAETTQGFIVKIIDGDTVNVSGKNNYTCRLYGIDAPESSQAYGKEATNHLKSLILNKNVNIEFTGNVTYGRQVCRIKLNGVDINLAMVKEGYAWAYKQYLERPHASEYIEAENSARKARKGLWRDINPIPPWEFR